MEWHPNGLTFKKLRKKVSNKTEVLSLGVGYGDINLNNIENCRGGSGVGRRE